MLLVNALTSIFSSLFQFRRFVALVVTAEQAGRCKFTELMADHIFRNIHRHVFTAVIDSDRVTDKVRQDGRSPGPSFDYFFLIRSVQCSDLLFQVIRNKRSFFY